MIRSFIFIIICLTIVSCQKETDFNQNPLPPTNNDSIYLDRIDMVENGDTPLVISFVYDNRKRVVSMVESGTLGDNQTFQYYYSGNDTIPYLMRTITDYPGATDTLWTYRYYDAAGRTITDSSIRSTLLQGTSTPDVNTYVTQFSYAPSRIFSITTLIPTPFNAPFQDVDTSVLDARGNIVQTKTWRTINGTTALQATSNFTYDDKPHPFTFMTNYKMHQDIPSGETIFFEYFPVNNILTQVETMDGFPSMDINQSFQYTSNGLPSRVTVNDLGLGETWTLLFKYKAL